MPNTSLLDRPAPAGSSADVLHLTCCDDDVAMCGEDVSKHEWADDGPPCPLCKLVQDEGLPCPVTGCARRTGPV